MQDFSRPFGDAVRAARIERGYTQKQLAEKIDVDERTIAHREQGRGCRFPAPRPCSFFVLAWTIRKPFLRV